MIPNKWSVGGGFWWRPSYRVRVFLDGKEVRRVRSYDLERGRLVRLCTDGHTGYPEQTHMDPADSGEVCEVVEYGSVGVTVEPA